MKQTRHSRKKMFTKSDHAEEQSTRLQDGELKLKTQIFTRPKKQLLFMDESGGGATGPHSRPQKNTHMACMESRLSKRPMWISPRRPAAPVALVRACTSTARTRRRHVSSLPLHQLGQLTPVPSSLPPSFRSGSDLLLRILTSSKQAFAPLYK
jgi:hypothetical protein